MKSNWFERFVITVQTTSWFTRETLLGRKKKLEYHFNFGTWKRNDCVSLSEAEVRHQFIAISFSTLNCRPWLTRRAEQIYSTQYIQPLYSTRAINTVDGRLREHHCSAQLKNNLLFFLCQTCYPSTIFLLPSSFSLASSAASSDQRWGTTWCFLSVSSWNCSIFHGSSSHQQLAHFLVAWSCVICNC